MAAKMLANEYKYMQKCISVSASPSKVNNFAFYVFRERRQKYYNMYNIVAWLPKSKMAAKTLENECNIYKGVSLLLLDLERSNSLHCMFLEKRNKLLYDVKYFAVWLPNFKMAPIMLENLYKYIKSAPLLQTNNEDQE